MGNNSRSEEITATTSLKDLVNDDFSIENSLHETQESDELIESLRTNLLVLEGLQKRCAFVLKEVRYMMKIEETR